MGYDSAAISRTTARRNGKEKQLHIQKISGSSGLATWQRHETAEQTKECQHISKAPVSAFAASMTVAAPVPTTTTLLSSSFSVHRSVCLRSRSLLVSWSALVYFFLSLSHIYTASTLSSLSTCHRHCYYHHYMQGIVP